MLKRVNIPQAIKNHVMKRDNMTCQLCGVRLMPNKRKGDKSPVVNAVQIGHRMPLEICERDMAEKVIFEIPSHELSANARKTEFEIRKAEHPDNLFCQCQMCNNWQGVKPLLRLPNKAEREAQLLSNEAWRQKTRLWYSADNPIFGTVPKHMRPVPQSRTAQKRDKAKRDSKQFAVRKPTGISGVVRAKTLEKSARKNPRR